MKFLELHFSYTKYRYSTAKVGRQKQSQKYGQMSVKNGLLSEGFQAGDKISQNSK